MVINIKNIILIIIMLGGWLLFGISVLDYILGNLFGFFPTFKSSQIWGCLLGYLLSFYQTKKWVIPWLRGMRSPTSDNEGDITPSSREEINPPFTGLAGTFQFIYSRICLFINYTFFIAIPVLMVTSFCGLLFVERINFFGVLIFYIFLMVLGYAGHLNNLVRMICVYYFVHMWVSSQSPLLFPFQLPLEMHNIFNMLFPNFFQTIVIVVGIGAGIYFLSLSAATKRKYIGSGYDENTGKEAHFYEVWVDKFSFENRFFLGMLFCVIVLTILFINFIVDIIDIDIFMASILILFLDSFSNEDYSDLGLPFDWMEKYLSKIKSHE